MSDQVDAAMLRDSLAPELEYPSDKAPADVTGYGENEGFWVWDDDRKTGMHLWLGTWADYSLRMGRVTIWLPDGRILTRIQEGPGTRQGVASNGVLSAAPVVPYESWQWNLFGSVQPTTAQELRQGPLGDGPRVLVKVSAEARMISSPWVNGGFQSADAFEASDLSKLSGGFRLEQFLHAEGTIEIAGENPIVFSGVGNRTHRKGARAVGGGGLPGHFWTAAIFPSGRSFYIQWFGEGVGKMTLSECWVREGDIFHKAEVIDPCLFDPVLNGERFTIQLRSALGFTTIEAERVAQSFQTLLVTTSPSGETWGIDYDRDPYNLAMDQGFMRYEWNGEVACNFIERSRQARFVSTEFQK